MEAPETSEVLRVQLSLPFPILCDTERRVVQDWDIYNSREKGGIAKPAVFVIDPSQVVRYAPVDSVGNKVAVDISNHNPYQFGYRPNDLTPHRQPCELQAFRLLPALEHKRDVCSDRSSSCERRAEHENLPAS